MKTGRGTLTIQHGTLIDGTGRPPLGKLADVLVVDADLISNIAPPEDRRRILAVLQSGIVKAGRLAGKPPDQWASPAAEAAAVDVC